MLTLPPFELHQPTSLADAVALLARHGANAKLLAGGTDLLPNMKHRLFTPAHVVSLEAVPGLEDIVEGPDHLELGARVTLATLSESLTVRSKLPSLATAAHHVAGPQLREMATLGGNVCLDTRCVYYNQTHFWRKALGYCLKKDGTVCHVVKGGQRCVAAASNDTAPVLMTLDATVRTVSAQGLRERPIRTLYTADGIRNTVLDADEIVTHLRVPTQPGVVMGYEKLRVRAAIDYSALTLAVAAKRNPDGQVEWLRVVVNALGARPHEVKSLESFHGAPLDEAAVARMGEVVKKQCHPLTNINVDPAWRREILPELLRKAWDSAGV
jgi:4-hydroxybenzoyl-CoA reductase subunit beta